MKKFFGYLGQLSKDFANQKAKKRIIMQIDEYVL